MTLKYAFIYFSDTNIKNFMPSNMLKVIINFFSERKRKSKNVALLHSSLFPLVRI